MVAGEVASIAKTYGRISKCAMNMYDSSVRPQTAFFYGRARGKGKGKKGQGQGARARGKGEGQGQGQGQEWPREDKTQKSNI